MNTYCRHKVNQFHESFQNCSFDQDDVALFVVLTRDYAQWGSILRELGDFLAHPKEKDRGIALNSVKEASGEFEHGLVEYFSNREFEPPVVKGLGTHQELSGDLHKIFELAGITEKEFEIDGDPFRDFVFCIIFLLSSFKLNLGRRLFELKVEYAHRLLLYISYESERFPRTFVTMPILSLHNVWPAYPGGISAPKYTLENHIVRRFDEGFLGAIAYEDDQTGQSLSAKSFERGRVWPLAHSANQS
ncbi:MAG: hypothetical protein KBT82_02220 [Marinobacter sp.]|uniref:hypothetical protein n=1 Tax=Marinobacter sp. TaxID=50741 RepID=UPI001B3DC834|nr:hypothetical protein [Marinobacter sp.]MBQ0745563.1 hypothetical protein [Marinobacter sp.]MBQ0812995.1 hypothetical protein [Marinobacter sp.]|tara:strand:- start:771 stop:1508 length:738 start_codon:yes stop_codon:yes gene_type:complete